MIGSTFMASGQRLSPAKVAEICMDTVPNVARSRDVGESKTRERSAKYQQPGAASTGRPPVCRLIEPILRSPVHKFGHIPCAGVPPQEPGLSRPNRLRTRLIFRQARADHRPHHI